MPSELLKHEREPEGPKPQFGVADDEWWAEWDKLATEISEKWNTSQAALEVLSEMRR